MAETSRSLPLHASTTESFESVATERRVDGQSPVSVSSVAGKTVNVNEQVKQSFREMIRNIL